MTEQADLDWKDPQSPSHNPPERPATELGSWDGQPIAHVRLSDLDPAALASLRPHMATGEEGDAALLEHLQLVHLKRAAALLFHPTADKLIAGAYLRVGHFDAQHQLLEHHLLGGHLFAQLNATLDLLDQHILRAKAGHEGRFTGDADELRHALREALLNALVHKDYACGIPIQLRLQSDRILLWNPARLPENWSLERPKSRLLPRPANPDIAHVFQRAGLISGWGTGIERMIDACRRQGLETPLLRQEQQGLWVEFSLLPAPRQPMRRTTSEPGMASHTSPAERTYIYSGKKSEAMHKTVEVTKKVTGEERHLSTGHVSSEVRRLLMACQGIMSRKALQDALGLRSDANFRNLYLVPALEAGLLEMTIPDKPKSSRQQYRLSARAEALRQQWR